MFRKMPFVLLATILFAGISSQWLMPTYQSILYGISLSIKSLIVFFLPFVIFGLLFKTAVNFAGKASKMIFFILFAICLSNFLSTLVSYSVGSYAYYLDLSIHLPTDGSSLVPAWELSLPKWIANDQAMFSGLLLGALLGWFKPALVKRLSFKLEVAITLILKAILYIVPFFIAGFIVKLGHDQVILYILRNYSIIFLLITIAVFSYISLIYLLVNNGNAKSALLSIKNMIPAGIAGFGSMSSAAAMPLTILGVEKNCKNPALASSIVPATVNIHLMGDCFAIPIFAFAVMKSFGVADPTFTNYLIFAAYFVLAKFSVAAVPGGGILVMLPILESYLGFNAEMLSLITALYILFDPVITCANIFGNGSFAMVIDNLTPTKKLCPQDP